jgi:hypothetical protein
LDRVYNNSINFAVRCLLTKLTNLPLKIQPKITFRFSPLGYGFSQHNLIKNVLFFKTLLLTKFVKLLSCVRPQIGCFVKELLQLDLRGQVANLLAGEQHLQGRQEDPACHGPGRTLDLKYLELLDSDVVKLFYPSITEAFVFARFLQTILIIDG